MVFTWCFYMVFVSSSSWQKIPRFMLQRISWIPYKMAITTITLKIKDNFIFLNVWKLCGGEKVKTGMIRHLLGLLHKRRFCAKVSPLGGQVLTPFLAWRCSQVHKLLPEQKTSLNDWSQCINNQGRYESYLSQSTLRPFTRNHICSTGQLPHWSSNVDLKEPKADF